MAYENNVRKILMELEEYSDGKVLSAEYEQYLLNINMLSDMIDAINPKDGRHAPVLSAKDINDLIGLYNRTFDLGAGFLNKAAKEKSHGDKTFSVRKKLVERAQEKLLGNIAALSAGAGAQNMTYEEVLSFAGGRAIDIDGDKLGTVGGAMSTRIPISFKVKGDNGEEIEEQGFFTEYGKMDLIRERDELIERASAKNETLKRIFEALFKKEKFFDEFHRYRDAAIRKHINEGRKAGRSNEKELAHILSGAFSDYDKERPYDISLNAKIAYLDIMKDINRNPGSPSLNKRITTFLREYPSIVNKYSIIYDRAKIESEDSLEDRNAAMTTVAQILGCPEVVAKSTKMSISVGGKRKDGVYMEKAQGEDLADFTPEKPLAFIEPFRFVTPKGLSNLADLQILDFICGNIDRHLKNMLYKTVDKQNTQEKKTVVDGFTGIDNDSSFGLIDGKSRVCKLPSIDELGYINRKTADRILAMSPDTLGAALSGFKLTQKEIEAAKKRLKLVRSAICNKKISIVENNGWEKRNIENFWCLDGGSNYFNFVSRLPDNVNKQKLQFEPEEIEKREKSREEFSRVYPKYEYPAEKKKFEYAEGELTYDPTILGCDHNRVKFIQHSIDTATAFLGTERYSNISKMLTRVGKLADSYNSNSEIFDWMKLKKQYELLHKEVNKYLAIKDQQSREKQLDGKELSNTAKRRVNAMSCLEEYLSQREAAISKYVASEKKKKIDKDETKKQADKLKVFKGKKISDERFARWLAKEYVLDMIAEGKKPRYVDEYNCAGKLLNSEEFRKFVINQNKNIQNGKTVDFESAKKQLFEKVNVKEIIEPGKAAVKQGQPDAVLD